MNIRVFIDEDKWFIEFITDCENLAKDYHCLDYERRPDICLDHPDPEFVCEFDKGEPPYDIIFEKCGDLERYLKQQGKRWKWDIK